MKLGTRTFHARSILAGLLFAAAASFATAEPVTLEPDWSEHFADIAPVARASGDDAPPNLVPGAYYDPTESGWGVFVMEAGPENGQVAMTLYSYRFDGAAQRWLITTAPPNDAGVQFFGFYSPSGKWLAQDQVTGNVVGGARVEQIDSDHIRIDVDLNVPRNFESCGAYPSDPRCRFTRVLTRL